MAIDSPSATIYEVVEAAVKDSSIADVAELFQDAEALRAAVAGIFILKLADLGHDRKAVWNHHLCVGTDKRWYERDGILFCEGDETTGRDFCDHSGEIYVSRSDHGGITIVYLKDGNAFVLSTDKEEFHK